MAKSISIKLPDDIHQWLVEESERDERTKSAIILRALREYREKREGHHLRSRSGEKQEQCAN